MNRQEIFDKAYRGLASQGFERSMLDSDPTFCAYRGTDGRKCAIGWCISDEKYDESFEKNGAGWPGIAEALGVGEDVSLEDFGFLDDLQEMHDLHGKPEEMKLALQEFAESHGLDIPDITKETST